MHQSVNFKHVHDIRYNRSWNIVEQDMENLVLNDWYRNGKYEEGTAENNKIIISISGIKNFIIFDCILLFKVSGSWINSVSDIPVLQV